MRASASGSHVHWALILEDQTKCMLVHVADICTWALIMEDQARCAPAHGAGKCAGR